MNTEVFEKKGKNKDCVINPQYFKLPLYIVCLNFLIIETIIIVPQQFFVVVADCGGGDDAALGTETINKTVAS